jgi:hypothetical protein
MREHNHAKKLRKLIAQGKILSDGRAVSQVDIAHDPWCRLLRKGKRCNCDPDICVSWLLEAASQN